MLILFKQTWISRLLVLLKLRSGKSRFSRISNKVLDILSTLNLLGKEYVNTPGSRVRYSKTNKLELIEQLGDLYKLIQESNSVIFENLKHWHTCSYWVELVLKTFKHDFEMEFQNDISHAPKNGKKHKSKVIKTELPHFTDIDKLLSLCFKYEYEGKKNSYEWIKTTPFLLECGQTGPRFFESITSSLKQSIVQDVK